MLLTCPNCRVECTVDNQSIDTMPCPTCGLELSTRTVMPPRQVFLGKPSAPEAETRDASESAFIKPASDFVLPVRMGKYFIESLISQGGFAKVYLATDEHLGRRVALKIPRVEKFNSPAKLQQFLAEARTAAKLRHSGIVTIFDVGLFANGVHYIAMEYVAGKPLSQLMDAGRIPIPRAVDLLIKVADAIHFAHGHGFYHRDLKPGNILLDERGEPRVVDFGLAVHETGQDRLQGDVSGTPPYMSPEQFRGDVHRLDGRTDIWSLGVVLYELLTGRRPFKGDTKQVSEGVQHWDPKPPRQIDDKIPEELESICLKCLSKAVVDRYRTAKDLADALGNWRRKSLGELPQSPSNDSVQEQPLDISERETIDEFPPEILGDSQRGKPPVQLIVPATSPVYPEGNLRRFKHLPAKIALAVVFVTTVTYAAVQFVPSRLPKVEPPPKRILTPPLVERGDDSGDTPKLRDFFRVDRHAKNGRWFPLLDREPNPLFWRGDTDTDRWVYDKSREEVTIDSLDAGFLGVGLTDSYDFTLKTGIVKKSFTGQVGLFWGYQAQFNDGQDVTVCHTAALACVPEKADTKFFIRRVMFFFDSVAGTHMPNTRSREVNCPSVEVSQPGPTANELEVEVVSGLVKQIRWCGQKIPALTDNENTLPFVTPVTTGWFGVWSRYGTSVFLNTEFKANGGPIK